MNKDKAKTSDIKIKTKNEDKAKTTRFNNLFSNTLSKKTNKQKIFRNSLVEEIINRSKLLESMAKLSARLRSETEVEKIATLISSVSRQNCNPYVLFQDG